MTHLPSSEVRPNRTLRLPYLLTLLIAVGILWGTLSPPGPPPVTVTHTDKLLHALAFMLLILPMAWTDLRRAVRLAPACIAFGGVIELVQPSFGRGAEWADLAADALGVVLGLLLGWVARRLRTRR